MIDQWDFTVDGLDYSWGIMDYCLLAWEAIVPIR